MSMIKDTVLFWKDSDGSKYKLGFSQKQQVIANWLKLGILITLIIIAATVLYVLYALDKVDFFSTIMYR